MAPAGSYYGPLTTVSLNKLKKVQVQNLLSDNFYPQVTNTKLIFWIHDLNFQQDVPKVRT